MSKNWDEKTFREKLERVKVERDPLLGIRPHQLDWLISELEALKERELIYRQFLFDIQDAVPFGENKHALFRLLHRTEEVVDKYSQRREFEWRKSTAKRK